jgi:rRNA-processing protein FCF1
MGKTSPQTVVLDTGALIAFERGDAKVRALVREALKTKARLVIPAGVLGQAWRGTARQVPLRAHREDADDDARPSTGRGGGFPL